MLVALIVASTYWQAWAAPDLANKNDNAIRQISEFTIDRGRILAADGTVLARNRVVHTNNRTYYYRRYPWVPSPPRRSAMRPRTARARTRTLGQRLSDRRRPEPRRALKQIGNRLLGSTVHGSDIRLSLNLSAQRVAMNALGANCGAAMAIEPSTGRVLVLASKPSYNPNDVESHFGRINNNRGTCKSPLVDRATQGLYPPGSAFKVVTAAAALDSGKFTPESVFHDPGYCTEYGRRVTNFADLGRPEVFGTITLFQALQHSVNSVFCNIGIKLRVHTLMDYARRFGFDAKPPIDLPSDTVATSGLYNHDRQGRHLLSPARMVSGIRAASPSDRTSCS